VFVALGIQYAECRRHIVIRDLPGSTIFFPHYLTNGTIFGEKSLNTKCVFWFALQGLSQTFLILRRNKRDIIKNVNRLHVKYRLFLLDCNETWVLCTDFRKIPKYRISRKSVHWEAPYGRTDMKELIVLFPPAILRTRPENRDYQNLRFKLGECVMKHSVTSVQTEMQTALTGLLVNP